MGFSTRHRGYEGCATSGTVLGQHQVEADVGLHKLSDLLHHQVVEFRVETIHRTVNANRHTLLVHLVDEGSDTGGHEVGGPAGHALADVAHVRAVLVGGVLQAQLVEHVAAVAVRSGLVGLDF